MNDLPRSRKIVLAATMALLAASVLATVGFTLLDTDFYARIGATLALAITLFLTSVQTYPVFLELLRPRNQPSDAELKNAFAELAQAGVLFKEEQYADAARKASNVIAILPKKAEAYRIRAQANAKLSNFSSSLEDYDIAISLEPGHPFVHGQRAALYRDMGELEKSIPDSLISIALAPELPAELFWLAKTYFDLGGYEDARNYFEQVLNHPEIPERTKTMAQEFISRIEGLERVGLLQDRSEAE